MPSSLFIPPLSIRHASARARKKIFSFFLANLVNSPCVSPNPGRDAHFELDRLVLAKAAWSQCPRHALPSIFSLRLSVPSAAKNIFQWSRLGAQLARRTRQIGVGPKIKASATRTNCIQSNLGAFFSARSSSLVTSTRGGSRMHSYSWVKTAILGTGGPRITYVVSSQSVPCGFRDQ